MIDINTYPMMMKTVSETLYKKSDDEFEQKIKSFLFNQKARVFLYL